MLKMLKTFFKITIKRILNNLKIIIMRNREKNKNK